MIEMMKDECRRMNEKPIHQSANIPIIFFGLQYTSPNFPATVRLAQALTIPVIASGGLSNIEDIRQLCAVESEGVVATIAGRAIYDGSLNFKLAQDAADAGSR